MSWSNIPGQKAVKELIKSQLQEGRLSHAYLLLGPRGTGKQKFAWELAATCLCLENEIESCGSCLSCRKIEHNNHPDVRAFSLAEDKKKIGIDIIRDLQHRLSLKPFEADRRFFIINEADKMTPQASNCLLKSLEDPPNYATLLLLAEEESRLLPTILSRCQHLRFHPLSREKIASMLQKEKELNRDAALHLSRLAAGSPGRALKLAEDDELPEYRKKTLNFMEGLSRHKDVEILEEAEKWKKWLQEGMPLFDLLKEWFRDIIVYKRSGSGPVRNSDYLSAIKETARSFCPGELLEMLAAVERADEDIEANVRPELVLQVMLLNLKEKLSEN